MKCKNDPTKYYKGDEPSPKGRGFCASAEEVGVTKKGFDGDKWVVKEVKNGKRWMKVASAKKKTSPHGSQPVISNKQRLFEYLKNRRENPQYIVWLRNEATDEQARLIYILMKENKLRFMQALAEVID